MGGELRQGGDAQGEDVPDSGECRVRVGQKASLPGEMPTSVPSD